jgi:hypothetical protein
MEVLGIWQPRDSRRGMRFEDMACQCISAAERRVTVCAWIGAGAIVDGGHVSVAVVFTVKAGAANVTSKLLDSVGVVGSDVGVEIVASRKLSSANGTAISFLVGIGGVGLGAFCVRSGCRGGGLGAFFGGVTLLLIVVVVVVVVVVAGIFLLLQRLLLVQ